MKKKAIPTTILLLLASASPTFAQWETPWEPAPEQNVYSLITGGYAIISTNIINMGASEGLLEVIYLQKGAGTYRCITNRIGGPREAEHECAVCVEPDKK